MTHCMQCGAQSPDIARFCGQCGAPITQSTETEQRFDTHLTGLEPPSAPYSVRQDTNLGKTRARSGCGCLVPSTALLLTLVVLVVILVAAWFLVAPGVFTVQPIGALPDGVTFIYHSRSPKIPFFSSPDGLCLEIQGSVSLLCRASALAASKDLTDRIMLKLPYNHWAYLMSTGGREYEK
jgi:hypothetical protein